MIRINSWNILFINHIASVVDRILYDTNRKQMG